MKTINRRVRGYLPSRLMVTEVKRLGERAVAIGRECNTLRREKRKFQRQIENDLEEILKLQATWKPGKPMNPYSAVAEMLDSVLVRVTGS